MEVHAGLQWPSVYGCPDSDGIVPSVCASSNERRRATVVKIPEAHYVWRAVGGSHTHTHTHVHARTQGERETNRERERERERNTHTHTHTHRDTHTETSSVIYSNAVAGMAPAPTKALIVEASSLSGEAPVRLREASAGRRLTQ